MEFEAWWLLAIPLFFGLGWVAARVEQRAVLRESRNLPDAYFKGLNFLLNEQYDKAIDAFIDVVKLDPDTIELNFALGNLFRRRGETDRAIRVHQYLAERPDIDSQRRERALFELGQDNLKAGMLDRAEEVFERLKDSRYSAGAMARRLEIAQMVRDWPLAIDLAERTQAQTGTSMAREIGHFHCELATRALASKAPDGLREADREIEQALTVDSAHVRAHLLQGQMALKQHQPELAITAWKQLAAVNPEYLALVADDWLQAHRELGRLSEGIESLERVLDGRPSVDALVSLAHARTERDGQTAAFDWAEQMVRSAPSLLGLEALLSLHAPQAAEEQRRGIDLVQKLIHEQATRLSRYQCRQCGLQSRQFYWQCPSCNRWDSYSPRRSEEVALG